MENLMQVATQATIDRQIQFAKRAEKKAAQYIIYFQDSLANNRLEEAAEWKSFIDKHYSEAMAFRRAAVNISELLKNNKKNYNKSL